MARIKIEFLYVLMIHFIRSDTDLIRVKHFTSRVLKINHQSPQGFANNVIPDIDVINIEATSTFLIDTLYLVNIQLLCTFMKHECQLALSNLSHNF